MLLEPRLILELALLGCTTGVLSGLLGIGGGMMMVPFISILLDSKGYPAEYVVKIAVATSLATICFTSLSSVRAHNRRGAVRWHIAGLLAPGILAGSIVGSQIAVALPAKTLNTLFAGFLIFSATRMFMNRAPEPNRRLPGRAGCLGVGTLIGVVSSMVGAGGAFISVPFMTWCNVKIHDAVGTSAALGFPIALFGTIGYIWAGQGVPRMPAGSVGYLYLPGLIVISMCSVSTAGLGAHLAHRMDITPLKRAFAVYLYLMAAYFILR
jgi:uncharacterized membrane protein YfcA